MNWTDQAKFFADGAERARQEGDHVTMIVLLKGAAECAQIARLLGTKQDAESEFAAATESELSSEDRK